ncbi:MAG: hypothetical protein AAGF58_14885 [Pseudomonadota bacterium]
MDSDRFRQLLESYGANLDRWPSEEKQAALDLLARSTELQDLQRQSRELDLLLDAWEVPSPSPELYQSVLPPKSVAIRKPVKAFLIEKLMDGMSGWIVRPMAATAMAASIVASGFFTGYMVPETTVETLLDSEVSEMILPTVGLTSTE